MEDFRLFESHCPKGVARIELEFKGLLLIIIHIIT